MRDHLFPVNTLFPKPESVNNNGVDQFVESVIGRQLSVQEAIKIIALSNSQLWSWDLPIDRWILMCRGGEVGLIKASAKAK